MDLRRCLLFKFSFSNRPINSKDVQDNFTAKRHKKGIYNWYSYNENFTLLWINSCNACEYKFLTDKVTYTDCVTDKLQNYGEKKNSFTVKMLHYT